MPIGVPACGKDDSRGAIHSFAGKSAPAKHQLRQEHSAQQADILKVYLSLTILGGVSTFIEGDSYPPFHERLTIPTVWLFAFFFEGRCWLSIAGCYGHVQAERLKTINCSRGRVRHPAFAIFKLCQSYKSRGALCFILCQVQARLNLHYLILAAMRNWPRALSGFKKLRRICWPCPLPPSPAFFRH